MRKGRSLQPPIADAISLTIGNFHDAPLNAHKFGKNVYPSDADRDHILETDSIYLYHPSSGQDLRSPLALTPLSPAQNPILIENQHRTRVHSAKDPNISTYTIYMYLPHDVDHKITIQTMLKNHFSHVQAAGLPKSPEGLDALQVQENSTYSVHPELDDEPITSTTQVIPSQLSTCPYSFTSTLPTFSTVAYGLLLLSSIKIRLTTSLPNTRIPTIIAENIRQAMLQQVQYRPL
jgi:hypothetical protein